LDDDLWDTLHERARAQGTTVSALVREALRVQYPAPVDWEKRRKAMEAFVGIRRDSFADVDPVEYVNWLRDDRQSRRIQSGRRREE
jgi:Ribbon-helix-helix protein, copG family